MDQMNREFVPHVLIVPVGSRVTFPNSDTVSHQVYSFSPAKKFQFPLYRGSPNPPVDFDRVGVVTIGCNIHDQMRAYVFVVDGQYYGRTDANGAWSAADVEPGEYAVQVWHPLAREMRPIIEQQIRVTDAPAGNYTDAARRHAAETARRIHGAGQLGRVLMRSCHAPALCLCRCCCCGGRRCPCRDRGQPRPAAGGFQWPQQLPRRRLGQAALRCR